MFLKFLAIGMLPAILVGFVCFFSQFVKYKKAYFIVCDIFICLLFTGVFLLFINILNFGEFRAYLLLAYTLGFIIERKTLGKLFAKLHGLLYNGYKKQIASFKKTRMAKFLFK